MGDPPRRYSSRMRRILFMAVVVLSIGGLAGPVGAATHRTAKKSTTATTSSTSIGELPVISCTTTYGGETPASPPFVASQLPTTTTAKELSYYSNGLITVMGPAGWACSALVAGDGGQNLSVYPPGEPRHWQRQRPRRPKDAQNVALRLSTPGTSQAPMSCAASSRSRPRPAFVQSAQQPCAGLPAGEKTTQLTPDVVTFVDPPRVVGAGAGSGGTLTSIGAAVYPQLPFGGDDSVNVDVLGCTLGGKLAQLCRPIEGDFLVRNPPTYVPPPLEPGTPGTAEGDAAPARLRPLRRRHVEVEVRDHRVRHPRREREALAVGSGDHPRATGQLGHAATALVGVGRVVGIREMSYS